MGCLMNVLWLVFGGIFTAVEYMIASLLMMITIVGIPFGMQTMKMAGLALWPFGKDVRSGDRSSGCLYILMNVLWIFLGGIWICLSHLGFGILLCITIIGIPFGMQHFKLAALALAPFGKDIVTVSVCRPRTGGRTVKEEGRKLKNFLPSFILFKGVIYMVMEACFASSFCSLPFSVWHIAPLPIA